MILVEKIETFNWKAAVRGMRNPLNSWDKSDSLYSNGSYYLEKNDLELMHKLYSAGPEHRKYMRQIMVSMDITAPLYWWTELQQIAAQPCIRSWISSLRRVILVSTTWEVL